MLLFKTAIRLSELTFIFAFAFWQYKERQSQIAMLKEYGLQMFLDFKSM
jgi:hypothetical protein